MSAARRFCKLLKKGRPERPKRAKMGPRHNLGPVKPGLHPGRSVAQIERERWMWQDAGMDRQNVVAKLREHERELRAAGVVHLSLFGSVARGEESAQSDVDLMAEFDESRRYSLLDRVRLERRLAEILGVPVDLAPARTLNDDVRERATHEAMLAF
jgi:uncharacterized protein